MAKKKRRNLKSIRSNFQHFKVDKVPELIGIAAEFIPVEARGKIIVRAFVDSSQEMFHKAVQHFYSIFLSKHVVLQNRIDTFLIIKHLNNTADIYVNDFPYNLQVIAKHDMQKHQLVSLRDIADIVSLHFPGINITPDDCLVYCFRTGWRFGLYFDFRPQRGEKIDIDDTYKFLGIYYRHLAFYNTYSNVADQELLDKILKEGWFPFFELIDRDFERLSESVRNSSLTGVQEIVNSFNKERIESIINRWWRKDIFSRKKPIIMAGINAYLLQSDDGYINCIKTLYSEIEGIIRLSFFNEYKKDPSFKDLVDHVHEKAKEKFSSAGSLGFPSIFYEYLEKNIFTNFDLETGKITLSRHTSSHGIAEAEQYSKQKALQAILVLDQIYFFI